MAYIPPLNGGRLNASIGSTAGGTAYGASLISTGTMNLIAGSNITLSQNANVITINAPGAAAAASNTIGASLGNVSGNTGYLSGSVFSYAFSGGNNITLSQSIVGGSQATLGISGPSFANANGITFGMNNGTLTASVAPSGIQAVSASNSSLSSGNLYFSNANGLSFGLNGSVMTASYTVPAQAQASINFSAPNTSTNASALIFANSNGVGFGLNGNMLTASYTQQPNLSAGMSAAGNSVGNAGFVSNALAFVGGNNITLSQSTTNTGGTITINGPTLNQSLQTQNNIQAFSAGTASQSSGTIVFSNSNNVAFGLNAGTVTASYTAGSNVFGATTGAGSVANPGTVSASNAGLILAAGNNITLSQTVSGGSLAYVTINGPSGGGGGVAVAATNSTLSSGTAVFSAASGALTISGSSNSLNFGVPATSSIVGANGITLATNGSTISIGVVNSAPTFSRWEYPEDVFGPLSVVSNSQLSFQHMYIPFNVVGSAAKVGGMMYVGTSTANAVGSVSMSLSMGLYTLNGSTLSLLTNMTGYTNNSFTWQGATSVSTALSSTVSGMRQLTVPLNANITPGEYWMGALMVTSSSSLNATFSLYGNSAYPVGAGALAPALMPIGAGVGSARDVVLFEGIYTANTTALPTNIQGSQINNTAAGYVMRANFYNAIFNATY